MYTIIKLDETNVYIGTSDEKIVKVPITALNFTDPKIGDEVKVYKADDTVIIARVAKAKPEDPIEEPIAEEKPVSEVQPQYQYAGQQSYGSVQQTYSATPQSNLNEKRVNKHIFVWVGNFLFGGLGVDRFLRGQIGLGILKLLTCGAFGVWSLIDFIISLTKVYGNAYADSEDVIFVNGKYSR